MNKRLPPLNPLKTFEALARQRSVKRAAEELNVTHGAISHQVRILERVLSLELLDRSEKGIVLTAAGAALLPATSTALDGIRAAVERIKGYGAEGELTISCVPALLSFWIIPRLTDFVEKYPDIRLTIIPSNDTSNLDTSGPHVKIRYGNGNWPDLTIRHLSDLNLFPVYSPILHSVNPINCVDDLRKHTLLHSQGMLEWNNWLSACSALHVKSKQQTCLSDASIALECAIRGLGVALGDSVTTGEALEKGQLIAPLSHSVRAIHSFYLVYRSDTRTLPQVQAFAEWLIDAFKSFSTPAKKSPSAN